MTDYASSTIREQIKQLESQRDQLVRQQTEYKTDTAETLAGLDTAIAEIIAGIALLSPRDDSQAILVLDVKRAQFERERAALLAKIAEFEPRNTAAEIAALEQMIAALEASSRKVPFTDEGKTR